MTNEETNPEQSKPIKQITKASDLEGLAILDNIEIFYSLPKSKNNHECSDVGIYAGSFDKDNKKYFVLSKTNKSMYGSKELFVQSEVYGADNSSLTFEMHVVDGYCIKDKLKEKLQRHLEILSK